MDDERIILLCVAARVQYRTTTMAEVGVQITNADPSDLFDVRMDPWDVDGSIRALVAAGLIEKLADGRLREDDPQSWPLRPTVKGWASVWGPR